MDLAAHGDVPVEFRRLVFPVTGHHPSEGQDVECRSVTAADDEVVTEGKGGFRAERIRTDRSAESEMDGLCGNAGSRQRGDGKRKDQFFHCDTINYMFVMQR